MITRTAAELADLCGAKLEGNGEVQLVGPASLSEAAPDQISFLRDTRFERELQATRAGAVVVPLDLDARRDGLALLRSANPNQTFSQVIASFRPQDDRPPVGVHAAATVAGDAELAAGVSVAAGCVVGSGVQLGENVCLYPGVVLGARVRLGAGTIVYPNVTVYADCTIGRRCIVHAGAVIGSDGFGFDPTAEGWEKVPQCGTVEIADDVEIGANCAIDRGRFGPTRIEAGVKIDNLVHLAHNVVIERGALLAAQAGVAGSSSIGERAILAGQVGVAGHLTIGPGARVAAQSGVAASLPGGKDYFGSPALNKGEAYRIEATLKKLPDMRRRMLELEKRLNRLEGGGAPAPAANGRGERP